MNDNLKSGLEWLFIEEPRGPNIGSYVLHTGPEGDTRRFTVAATQRWATEDKNVEVGLVWVGLCDGCDRGFWQVTRIRDVQLRTECQTCDVVGSVKDSIEGFALSNFMEPLLPKKPEPKMERPVKRRGRVEMQVLEVITLECTGVDRMLLSTLSDLVANDLPAPGEDERDTRRQRAMRAIQQLAREKDGPLKLEGVEVVFDRSKY